MPIETKVWTLALNRTASEDTFLLAGGFPKATASKNIHIYASSALSQLLV